MNTGSCLCGEIQFKVSATPQKVSHCHCFMCQKQHGAAFATYARFKRVDITYLSGIESLRTYRSSAEVERKFCMLCGSNIEWAMPAIMSDCVAIALASLDDQSFVGEIKVLHRQSSAQWLDASCVIEDD
ncbi:MAG: hypothetical protein BM565_02515 [Gammaproteobacteria bacterium MedPE]|nr:MAG: hypothetical protein BM565_02515 [Gammaproteobacteria bacterium MedPE]